MRSPCALWVLSILLEFFQSRAEPVVGQQSSGNGAVELHAHVAAAATSSANSMQSIASSNLNANTNLKAEKALSKLKATTPKDAQGRPILAVPPPDGHTSQVSPVNPNGDREWYPEGRVYKAQDGVITEQPEHAPTQQEYAEKSSAGDDPPRRSAFAVACFALLGALAFGALPPPLFAFL